MTSLTLINETSFDDLYATNLYVDSINANDLSTISVDSAMNFTVLPTIQNTGLATYVREQLTVSGALSYTASTGLLTGISVDNYNRDVILSLSGTTILSADLTSGTGQSLVLYMNYSQTVGSNKALGITPTNTSQTILSTLIAGNTTSLIATFEILQATLNQTFIPSGIFDINLFTAESNANDGLEVYAELYTVSSLGVETLFSTTDQIEVVEQYPSFSETTLSAVNVQQEALEIGGAFRMKIYGVNSRGSAHTLYTYYEGTGAGYSHLHTPFNVALAGGYWSENGTTVYLTNTGNNVAIGKTSATERLEVSGNILANDIYGLNVSAGTGVYNYLSGLSISGTNIKCDTATFTNGNILGLTANNLNANNLTVVSSATFNGAFTVATSASFNAGISVGQSSTFMGEVLVGSGNSTSLFVGGRTTLGNNGLRLHTPLGANINTFVDTKQPAGGSLVFRLDDTLGATERMRLSQSGLSVGTTNMSQRLVVNGNVLVNTNQPITTASSQGMYMTWSRSSPINPVQGGSFGSRGISFLLNQRGSGPGGICLGEVGTDNSASFNAFLDPSGSLFLAGALVASGGRSQVFDLNVSGGASFNSNLTISGALSLSGPLVVSSNATFLSGIVVNGSATFNTLTALNATFSGNISCNTIAGVGSSFATYYGDDLILYDQAIIPTATIDYINNANITGANLTYQNIVSTDSATFNGLTVVSITGTNGRLITISGTNVHYTTATFTNINIAGQYAINGATFNAVAPIVYNPTLNRISMPQVDDLGTDGYLSSAQYDALASASILWTEDTTNKILYPSDNSYNVMTLNSDLSGSPAVRDTGLIWRRTTLSGTLDHYLRMRTGGAKDGYLIHQNMNSAPVQWCAGALQPAFMVGGTFNDLIEANTAFHIKTFQNNAINRMKMENAGASSSTNYCEIELQDPSNDISFRTAGNSENLLIRDNTRSVNRIQITPTTLFHAGATATLVSTGNTRVDIGNATTVAFIDFNVNTPANDFDCRIAVNQGTAGTIGSSSIDLWSGAILLVQPTVSDNSRTRITNTGAIGVQCAPSTALTVSGNIRLNNTAGALQFSDANVAILRANSGMDLQTSATTRLNISANGNVAIGLTFNSAIPGETQNPVLKVGATGTNPSGGVVIEPFALYNTDRLFSTGKETRIAFYQYFGSTAGDVGRMMTIGCVMESGDKDSGLRITNLNNGALQVPLSISANGDTSLIRIRGAVNTVNRTTAIANSVNGKVSFQGTLTGGALNETALIQSVAFTGSATNISGLLITQVNNGSGMVETMRQRSDTGETIFSQSSNSCSIFLNGRTQASEDGARWHYNGANIFFDGRDSGGAPDFFFRSNTTDGNTNRFQILGAGGTTCYGAMGQTVVAAIGATIAYWSGGNVLGIFASDRRSKNSIEPIADQELDELWETMRPVKYFFNIDANNPTNPETGARRKYYGFIANDLDNRIQTENRNVKIQMCGKCQMRCFHDAECDCPEYDALECECLPEWTTNIRNYSERDLIAVLTAKVKQQERLISEMRGQMVRERIQYKAMEDKQNRRVGRLEQTLSALMNKLELQGIRTK